jgi:hypothetical protein
MIGRQLYYAVKPCIPRAGQVTLHRYHARHTRRSCRTTWPINPRAGEPPPFWQGWPQGKRFALVLNHDVDTARGQKRVCRLLQAEAELGFHSAFRFVPERYPIDERILDEVRCAGFEVGIHGLRHDGKLFRNRQAFDKRAPHINRYIASWDAQGFSSPAMHHHIPWMSSLNVQYGTTTFDTDPFEPQPDGASAIFPFAVYRAGRPVPYIEMPYTLPQDFTLFVILQLADNQVWKDKLAWIVERGGMALLNSHPDYMCMGASQHYIDEYPLPFYREFLAHIKSRYAGEYWHPLPCEMADFWLRHQANTLQPPRSSNPVPTCS